MQRKRPGLGKGLDALIPMDDASSPSPSSPHISPGSSGAAEIPVAQISPNPRQPRAQFDAEGITELASSIKEHGVIQPLIVTQADIPGSYTLIAGERRLLASKEAGLEVVPVVIREASDQERLEIALIENVQRADLSALETAEAYRQLVEDFKLAHGEIAKRVGKSRVAITNTLRLLNLPPSVKQALAQGKITEGHARTLLSLSTSQAQAAALQTIITKELNVRQTEALVRKLSGEKTESQPKPSPVPEITELEEKLRTSLGTKVTLKHGQKGGTITVHYYSDEELDSLIEKFMAAE
ncbi:MAG: ParB/RepB/Spo0J family partition protein [Anaerolineales bacterium]|nr:ParB/RepB/Spo0J family partition protein [Chloroflexota bacterium]MBL6980989.1 ParB/RepB/Spo0J family partition protein [Anaerolineales bacterium]